MKRKQKRKQKDLTVNDLANQLALIQFGVFAKMTGNEDVRAIGEFMVSAIEGKQGPEQMRRVIRVLEPMCAAPPWSPNGEGGENGPVALYRELCAAAVARLRLLCAEGAEQTVLYCPNIEHEVRGTSIRGDVVQGHLGGGYGTSMYDFHGEYPIDGMACRKSTIAVLVPGREPVPLFDYCREHGIVVVCQRCGEDITYQAEYGCGRGT